MSVTWRKDGYYGYVELDNPPVNAIGQSVRQGLLDAVEWAEAEGLERVILSGKGRAFAAGADAREFNGPLLSPDLPDVFNRIEESPVFWIAAVHGPALGGGAELMMACRYRIATAQAVIGLPEVTLGVVPGAGGIQRLVRLVGSEKALDMIPTGQSVKGAQALEMGMIDEVDDNPVSRAEMINTEWLMTCVPVGELNTGPVDEAQIDAARTTAKKRMRGQNAPLLAIDLIEEAAITTFSEGLKRDREVFIDLRTSDQARALRHMFFSDRSAKIPARLKTVPVPELSEVAVVGGGTMGAGIAYALLSAGLRVVLLETDSDGVERAKANVGNLFEAGLARKRVTPEQAETRLGALRVTDDYALAGQAGLAIEAAFESMEVKEAVLSQLEAVLPKEAIIASNTSYLDLDDMAQCLSDPSRLIGLHFFAPAHIMKLLEIVQGRETSDNALALGFALGKTLRKIPVVSGVCDGFIGNRILARYREAADTLLMDGTNPWELDEAMVEFGYAMGPYEAQDLSGLDIAHANRRRQDATRDPNRRYIPIADRMVQEGRLGRKTSVGWYRYPGGKGKVIDPLVEDLVREEAHFAKVTRVEYDAEEIRRRLLLAMINEAADILAEGIAASAADIDLVTVHGYGFPRWRGGLMHYADSLTPAKVLADLELLSQEDAVVWAPSPMIRDCAEKGISFVEWRA